MLATASALLKKIESTPVKPAKKVALAYSGGLDSSLSSPSPTTSTRSSS